MQSDLSDGVRYLARQGTIDPKRVCIVGARYGGSAALLQATVDFLKTNNPPNAWPRQQT
jgi:dipeptidyl aminopeptidase/acylaminoacyl peptidase